MGTVSPVFVPTVADAQRAADGVADSGAGRVLLFGSVARGDAHHDSAIDLMVIYDDLDYSYRRQITARLSRLARSTTSKQVFTAWNGRGTTVARQD